MIAFVAETSRYADVLPIAEVQKSVIKRDKDVGDEGGKGG